MTSALITRVGSKMTIYRLSWEMQDGLEAWQPFSYQTTSPWQNYQRLQDLEANTVRNIYIERQVTEPPWESIPGPEQLTLIPEVDTIRVNRDWD